jgi:NitT/TauT family transport system substrate-binding protein
MAALLGLGLAACSSSPAPAPGAKGTSSLQTVTVAASASNVDDLAIWEAQKGGYYAKQGLNVKFPILSTATLDSALDSGSVDFLNENPTTLLQGLATGGSASQIVVEGLATGVPMGLVISTAFAKAHGITATTPPATVAKDLVGSTGGSSAKATLGEAYMFLRQYGVQPSQVKIATLSNTSADQAALQSNEIDWFCTSEPIPFQVQQKGLGIVVGRPDNVAEWQPSKTGLSEALVTTTNFANGNPGIVKKFVTATQQAATYLTSHQSQAVSLLQSEIPGLTAQLAQETNSLIDWLPSGQMSNAQWQTTLTFNESEGVVASGTKVTESVNWTNKYL